MPRHFANIDANVVLTPALTTTLDEVRCALTSPGLAIFVGDPRTGKDFAIEHALETLDRVPPVLRIQFSRAPRELELCDALFASLGEERLGHERSSRQMQRLGRLLAEENRVVYLKEAQHLSRGGFGTLRQIFDESDEGFAIIMSGSEDFADKLKRYGCLDGRKVAGQAFAAMPPDAVLQHVPRFHRLYEDASEQAIGTVNQGYCKGRWGHWAAFTKRLQVFKPQARTLTVPVAREVLRTIKHA